MLWDMHATSLRLNDHAAAFFNNAGAGDAARRPAERLRRRRSWGVITDRRRPPEVALEIHCSLSSVLLERMRRTISTS